MSYHICNASPVLQEIADERDRQDDKWGEQNHPDGTGPNVALAFGVDYAPRYAELAGLACKRAALDGKVTWRHILLEEVFEALAENDEALLRAELGQVAAVAVAWIEAIDRRAAVPSETPEANQ